jgi:subtilisin-like proprotein convertase family protein
MLCPRRLAGVFSLSTFSLLGACGGGGLSTDPGVPGPVPQVFSNDIALTIPEAGHATVYPTSILVPGAPGTVAHVTVQLVGVTHTHPQDLDVVLVSPAGTAVMLLSDAGGVTDISALTLTFDDAGAPASQTLPLTGATTHPTDHGLPSSDGFVPGPAGPWVAALSLFDGEPANGIWRLYVVDDQAGDAGSMLGWNLILTTQ